MPDRACLPATVAGGGATAWPGGSTRPLSVFMIMAGPGQIRAVALLVVLVCQAVGPVRSCEALACLRWLAPHRLPRAAPGWKRIGIIAPIRVILSAAKEAFTLAARSWYPCWGFTLLTRPDAAPDRFCSRPGRSAEF